MKEEEFVVTVRTDLGNGLIAVAEIQFREKRPELPEWEYYADEYGYG
jgi:hypothetical protein